MFGAGAAILEGDGLVGMRLTTLPIKLLQKAPKFIPVLVGIGALLFPSLFCVVSRNCR